MAIVLLVIILCVTFSLHQHIIVTFLFLLLEIHLSCEASQEISSPTEKIIIIITNKEENQELG
jgi:hypothetical protein